MCASNVNTASEITWLLHMMSQIFLSLQVLVFFSICFFNYLLIHGFHITYPFLQIPSLADPACSDLSLCATLFYFSLPLCYAKTSVDPQWAILSKSLIYLPIKMSVYFVDMDGNVAMVYLLFDWFWISEFGCSLHFHGSSNV